MRYFSTRGGVSGISFKDAVMMGLATDGGLLLPESIPAFDGATLKELQPLSFPDLAFRIISLFADDIPAADLKRLIDKSYATFDHPSVTPTITLGDLHILELFHGPTLAFKDVALQLLGNLFDYLLNERDETMNIIGATSGDTGSAAIHGVRGKERINIFILHPHNKTSAIQRMQMTTVPDANVHNLAVEGTFDDCQAIVKTLFGDLGFKEKYRLGAVNSINWARVLAQVVYYFKAYFDVVPACDRKVSFSVPTGNFGDIFAGFLALRMGLPIEQLILATNENDILTRFVNDGDYSIASVHQTISPSMDIQLASNFERYLYYLKGENPAAVKEAMAAFARDGKLPVTDAELAEVRKTFASLSAGTDATLAEIKTTHTTYGYILDPHTAVGVVAGKVCRKDADTPLICLSTAHPAKFPDAVADAIGSEPPVPASVAALMGLEQRFDVIDAKTDLIRQYLIDTLAE